MIKTKESAAADRALRNARAEAEEELYNAWLVYFGMKFLSDLTEEEQEAIHARMWAAYDKGYELLSPFRTQEIIANAKKDSGN